MSQKAAEAVRGLLCQQMADAAFILRGVGRCVHLHDLSHPKPWKCSIRMQLLREMRILLFCSVVGLWRCSESFVIPSSAWLSPPPPPPFPFPLPCFAWLMRVLIEGYRHDRQSSLSSQYNHLFISSASNKNLSACVPVIAYHCLQSISVPSDIVCSTSTVI